MRVDSRRPLKEFGPHVTAIERGTQLAGREDPDIAAALLELFQDERIQGLPGAVVRRVEGRSGERVRVHEPLRVPIRRLNRTR